MSAEHKPKSQTKTAPPSPTRLASKFHVAWKTAATSTSARAKRVMPAPCGGYDTAVGRELGRDRARSVSRGGSFLRGRDLGDEDHPVAPVQIPGELDRTPFRVPRRPRDPERRQIGTHPEHRRRPRVERGGLQLLPGARHRETVPLAHKRVQAPAEILPEETGHRTLRQIILLQHQRLAVPGAHTHDYVHLVLFREP